MPHAQRVLGVEGFRLVAVGCHRLEEIVVPAIAFVPGDVHAGAAHDDRVLDARRAGHSLVGSRLEGQDDAVAPGAVLGDQDTGVYVDKPFLQGF
jgi:hypothetical protein